MTEDIVTSAESRDGPGSDACSIFFYGLIISGLQLETRKALRTQSRFRVETQCQYTSVSSRYETLSPKTFLLFED